MSIVFYTIKPEIERLPKEFIVEVFKYSEHFGTQIIQTVFIPVKNPFQINETFDQAKAFGNQVALRAIEVLEAGHEF